MIFIMTKSDLTPKTRRVMKGVLIVSSYILIATSAVQFVGVYAALMNIESVRSGFSMLMIFMMTGSASLFLVVPVMFLFRKTYGLALFVSLLMGVCVFFCVNAIAPFLINGGGPNYKKDESHDGGVVFLSSLIFAGLVFFALCKIARGVFTVCPKS